MKEKKAFQKYKTIYYLLNYFNKTYNGLNIY